MTTNEEQPFFTSRRESKRYIAESLQLQDALILGIVPPKEGIGRQLANALPEAMSFLWLDMSKRPALRDLARVHATEGEGEAVFKWVYIDEHKQNCYFVLNVNMQKPVRETFRIAIRMQEWAALVEVISTTGTMSIFAGPPIAWRQLIKTMEAPALIHLIHEQSRGDVTFTFSQETVTELRRHYEAWIEHFAKEEEETSTKKAFEGKAERPMNEAEKWIQLLTEWVTSMQGSSMLVTVADSDVSQTNLPSGTADEKAVNQCFQLGRKFALDHRSSWRTAQIMQIRLGGVQGLQTEKVLVSMLDGKTGEINAIPYTVIRDKQKRIVNLRDEGGLVQIAGTYLPAFYVGMRTSYQSEQQARTELAREMKRLVHQMTQELKKRMEE